MVMGTTARGVCPAILAGGLGTRLRSEVGDRPKVIATVDGRPFLAYLLDRLLAAGFDEAVLLVGYGADQVRTTFGERYGRLRLQYSVEPWPLGTAGAVRLAESFIQDRTVLLLNGDSYCDANLSAFLSFHTGHRGGTSLSLAEVRDAARFGRVCLEKSGRVVRFEEKQPAGPPGWINAGVYLFDPALVRDIPGDRPVSLERDVLPAWVARGEVYGFLAGGRFIDIGVPDSYRGAEAFFRGQERPAGLPATDPVGSAFAAHADSTT
jgi:NDP-sugar pyrophosphorylase family protein